MFSVIQRIRKRLLTRYPQVIVLRVNISSDTVRAQRTNHFRAQNPIGPRSRAENLAVLCFFTETKKVRLRLVLSLFEATSAFRVRPRVLN